MFNLLPENLKKKVKIEYKLRLTIMILFFIVLTQISFLVFMFPSWLSSHYEEKYYISKSEELNETLSTLDVSSTITLIQSINDRISIMNTTLDYPKFIPLIDSILSVKSAAIRLDGIYYTVTGSNKGELTINGIGDKRDSVVVFNEKLKGINLFKKVDLPISNLAKDKNIDFSINISVEE